MYLYTSFYFLKLSWIIHRWPVWTWSERQGEGGGWLFLKSSKVWIIKKLVTGLKTCWLFFYFLKLCWIILICVKWKGDRWMGVYEKRQRFQNLLNNFYFLKLCWIFLWPVIQAVRTWSERQRRLWKAAKVNDGSQDRHLHCSRIIYDPRDWSK